MSKEENFKALKKHLISIACEKRKVEKDLQKVEENIKRVEKENQKMEGEMQMTEEKTMGLSFYKDLKVVLQQSLWEQSTILAQISTILLEWRKEI